MRSWKLGLCVGALSAAAFVAVRAFAADDDRPAYVGSRFEDVWSQVASDPYDALPHIGVGPGWNPFAWGSFGAAAFASAQETLRSEEDLRPHFDKIVHPNGLCLRGTWTIDVDSPYTGYFAKGSKGLFIGRASTALSNTEQGAARAFGFAGKLFPTMDKATRVKTASFFTVDSLTGVNEDFFTNATLTNAPSVGIPGLGDFPLAIAVTRAFAQANKNPTERQMYTISQLGLAPGAPVVTPTRFGVRASEGTAKVDTADFRDELQVAPRGGHLRFDIVVGADAEHLARIGSLDFEESVASDSCDHRLHFAHPVWRDDVVTQ